MRPSLRFLTLAIVGWAAIRAAALGVLPGAEIFAIQPSQAKPPPIVQTQFAEIPPVDPVPAATLAYDYAVPATFAAGGYGLAYPRPLLVPVYYQGAVSAPATPATYTPIHPAPGLLFDPPPRQYDDWSMTRIAAAAMPSRAQSATSMQSAPQVGPAHLDRLQLTMWAMLRRQPGMAVSPSSLASGATLGGSQAGGRLFYNFSPELAAVLRSSSDVGRRGGELALGVRVRPLRSLPIWLTAERRQALGKYGGGRNAFALFAEGGLYDRSMPWGILLDGYVQGGVVGLKRRDLFVDGAFTLTRPVYRNFSAGIGMWGGAQPGLYRLDAGPRVTMRVRPNVRVHLDWRQRLSGNAMPASGPALTLAGDF